MGSDAIATGSSSQPVIRFVAEQTAADVIDGERKTVTALFADIKGSMELMQDLDPEEARKIVDPALGLMIEAVRHYGGYVVQSTGDGIFALFGAPIAHEDHPQRALYAAVRMIFAAMAESFRKRDARRLRYGWVLTAERLSSVQSEPARPRPNTRLSAIRQIWLRACRPSPAPVQL
jgi:class 3 adenylate cyclase